MGPFSPSLSILIFHRVLARRDPLLPGEICAEEFKGQLALLKRWFRILPLSEAVQGLRDSTLPSRAACITFDDGYADNATVALPILRAHGVPATFFVTAGSIDGGRMWNDTVIETVRRLPGNSLDASSLGLGKLDMSTIHGRSHAIDALLSALKYLPPIEREQRAAELDPTVAADLPTALMMTREQVRALHAAGMEIGAHTLSHPILAKVDHAQAEHEIAESRIHLESIIGAPVRFFAYPNGRPGQDYVADHVRMVKRSGYEAAVCTAWGVARPRADLFQLPRFTPWDRTSGRFLIRLFGNTFRAPATIAA